VQCTGSCPAVLSQAGNCLASVFQYSCQCNTLACSNSTLSVAGGAVREGQGGGLPGGLAACVSHFRAAVAVLWLSALLSVVFVVLEAAWRWPCAVASLQSCVRVCSGGRCQCGGRGGPGSGQLSPRGVPPKRR
jgi:hypothetical protein